MSLQVARRLGALSCALLLLDLLWRARRTRPEPLPPPPDGSRTVTASDGTVLYAEVGGREAADVTMVFVHGFLSRSIEFDAQWQHFSDKARLVRYDHRNHGRSGRSGRVLDIETLADDLGCVLRACAPTGAVVLVGHSMGGMTALTLVRDHPELLDDRVRGLALLATGAGHYLAGHRWENLVRWASRRRLLAPPLAAARLLSPGLERLRPRRTHTVRGATRRLLFGSTDADPATVAMCQELVEGPPLATLASLQGALLRYDVRSVLPRLDRLPVLVLTGSDDRLVRPEHSARIVLDVGPHAELVVVPGAGHVVNQTRPGETNSALSRLLDRVGPAVVTGCQESSAPSRVDAR